MKQYRFETAGAKYMVVEDLGVVSTFKWNSVVYHWDILTKYFGTAEGALRELKDGIQSSQL
jgi:hypothetical protein